MLLCRSVSVSVDVWLTFVSCVPWVAHFLQDGFWLASTTRNYRLFLWRALGIAWHSTSVLAVRVLQGTVRNVQENKAFWNPTSKKQMTVNWIKSKSLPSIFLREPFLYGLRVNLKSHWWLEVWADYLDYSNSDTDKRLNNSYKEPLDQFSLPYAEMDTGSDV